MKFDTLRSIGHNIADSLASGIGLMIGVYAMDIFGKAQASPGGVIEVDFLAGVCPAGQPSDSLARAIALYRDALPALCERQGATVDAFRHLSARYTSDALDYRFTVIVEDQRGLRVSLF